MAIFLQRRFAVLALLCISHASAFRGSVGIPKHVTRQARNVRTSIVTPSASSKHSALRTTPTTAVDKVAPRKRDFAKKILSRAALSLCALAFVSFPAHAASGEALHTGQKIANFFRSFGIPDLGVLTIISALPVVELRGAVPVGIWMGIPITTVLPVCIFGNMLPIVPLLYLLRNKTLKKLMQPMLDRAEKKTSELGIGSPEKQWASLAAFVGIPLPGTGAWTGAMGAFLLDMPMWTALSSIFAGVVAAGMIMTAITLAGKKGGVAALGVLFLVTGIEFFKADKDDAEASTPSSTPEATD